jgi:hypothetical protein
MFDLAAGRIQQEERERRVLADLRTRQILKAGLVPVDEAQSAPARSTASAPRPTVRPGIAFEG